MGTVDPGRYAERRPALTRSSNASIATLEPKAARAPRRTVDFLELPSANSQKLRRPPRLSRVSLECRAGENCRPARTERAGKSTLLGDRFHVDDPHRARVRYGGITARECGAGLRSLWDSQHDLHLYGELTAREISQFFAALYGIR